MQQKKANVHQGSNKKSRTGPKVVSARVDPETQGELMLAFTGSMLKLQCSYMMVLAAENETKRGGAKQTLFALAERTLQLLTDLEKSLERQ